MRSIIFFLVFILNCCGFTNIAQASLHVRPRHIVSEFETKRDSIAPAKPHVQVGKIIRGKVREYFGNSCSGVISSQDYLGRVSINVAGLHDNQTPINGMGLRIINLNEFSENGKQMEPDYDIKANKTIILYWADGSRFEQDPLDERFAVFAIDAAGNLSVEADTVYIIDPGRQKPAPRLSVSISLGTNFMDHSKEPRFDLRVSNISTEPVRITRDISSSVVLKVFNATGHFSFPEILSDIPCCESSATTNFLWLEPGEFCEKTISLKNLPKIEKYKKFSVIYWWKSCSSWPVERNERIESNTIPMMVH